MLEHEDSQFEGERVLRWYALVEEIYDAAEGELTHEGSPLFRPRRAAKAL